MDLGVVSLGVSAIVGIIQVLEYLHKRTDRKEQSHSDKLENHGEKISALESSSAVLIEQMRRQIAALEKLSDKLDDLK